jgi:hypothetical protein
MKYFFSSKAFLCFQGNRISPSPLFSETWPQLNSVKDVTGPKCQLCSRSGPFLCRDRSVTSLKRECPGELDDADDDAQHERWADWLRQTETIDKREALFMGATKQRLLRGLSSSEELDREHQKARRF